MDCQCAEDILATVFLEEHTGIATIRSMPDGPRPGESSAASSGRVWREDHSPVERIPRKMAAAASRLAIARRVGGNILLWAFTAIYWAAILSPIIYYVKGLLNV